MKLYTLLGGSIFALNFGNFGNICVIERKIGVGFALSCYVLGITAHSNGITVVEHFAKLGGLVNIK